MDDTEFDFSDYPGVEFIFLESVIDPHLAEYAFVNVGTIGYHDEEGQFILYLQPEASGATVRPRSLDD